MVRISLSAFFFALGLFALSFLSFTNSAHAGGAGGSWGDEYTGDGGAGGGGGAGGSWPFFGGGGAGGSWGDIDVPAGTPVTICKYIAGSTGKIFSNPADAAQANCGFYGHGSFVRWDGSPPAARDTSVGYPWCSGGNNGGGAVIAQCSDTVAPQCPEGKFFNGTECIDKFRCPAGTRLENGQCKPVDKPLFPDPDKPPEDDDSQCGICNKLYDINLKLNILHNYDLNIINSNIQNMYTDIVNIENSITNLQTNLNETNNYLVSIDNSMGDLITNIENNNITQNEIKNEVNNITNKLNEYSLQLGDLELAIGGINLKLGDIDAQIGSNNKLLLDLGLDVDFIKNKIANDDSKDYTPYLIEIIDLLGGRDPTDPTEPTEPTDPYIYDDTELLRILNELNDFIREESDAVDDGAVEVTDLTELINIDRNRVSFNRQCPSPKQIAVSVVGLSFSDELSYEPMCDFFTRLRPFVIGMGTISMILLIVGGARRG